MDVFRCTRGYKYACKYVNMRVYIHVHGVFVFAFYDGGQPEEPNKMLFHEFVAQDRVRLLSVNGKNHISDPLVHDQKHEVPAGSCGEIDWVHHCQDKPNNISRPLGKMW